jgi:glycosyltransferase involved in cell wall biosynthesis
MSADREQCAIVILTFNSARIIAETVERALLVSRHIFVVDSFSTDGTDEILRRMGCEIVQRPFLNYSDQRNWAIEQVSSRFEWQLHLDADEVIDDSAVDSIRRVLQGNARQNAYMLRRRDYFMERPLRFSGLNCWHLRLFRSGVARCEDRLYDQHFVSSENAGRLDGLMHDKNLLSLGEWTVRHNRWSDAEANEAARVDESGGNVLRGRFFGDPRERTRFVKERIYYRLPVAARALSYFFYRYIIRLGFLDGAAGFYFAFFQGLWFRMLVDAKIYERSAQQSKAGTP